MLKIFLRSKEIAVIMCISPIGIIDLWENFDQGLLSS